MNFLINLIKVIVNLYEKKCIHEKRKKISCKLPYYSCLNYDNR